MSTKCSQCGGLKFEEDVARGDMICLDCGAVMSENAVTASVEFVENAGGAVTAIGRFVSDESQMPGFRESRYITEQKARRRIETICGQLRLGPDVAVSAFRFYQSALFRGLTRGRSAMQLAAACIYVAARQLRVNLMLLDLSDAVAINVYHVGRTYVELKRKLNLSLPEIDPCLFVERFASQLEFENKTAAVATTAMRLLQRMKKDWISTGRRPSGLAAAALLVAARVHEFNRTEEDVAKVARISQMTARKRLVEFSKTPSSALSIDDFFTVDYDEEQDPPAFSEQPQKRRTSINDLDMSQVAVEIKELGRRIDRELDHLATKRKLKVPPEKFDLAESKGLKHLMASHDESSKAPPCKQTRVSRDIFRDVLDGVVEPDLLESCVDDLQMLTNNTGNQLCQMVEASNNARDAKDTLSPDTKDIRANGMDSENSAVDTTALKLPHFILPAENLETGMDMKGAELSDVKDLKGCSLDLAGVDEDELDREYFLAPQEVMVKATLWFQDNASFIEEQRRKKAERQRLKEELAKQPRKARKGTRSIYQRKRPTNLGKYDPGVDEDTMDEKPMSKKINYAALEAIVNKPGSSNDVQSASAPVETSPLRTVPIELPVLSNRPNKLIEATLRDTDILPRRQMVANSTVTFVTKNKSDETNVLSNEVTTEPVDDGEDVEEEEVDYEEAELDDDDWNAGADLW